MSSRTKSVYVKPIIRKTPEMVIKQGQITCRMRWTPKENKKLDYQGSKCQHWNSACLADHYSALLIPDQRGK